MPVGVLAFILGLIQALTEFLPVSSSAHLILARTWLDFKAADGLTFDVALHFGTLVAIVIYFRRDLLALLRGFVNSIFRRGLKDPNGRMAWFVIAACVPGAVVGARYETAIETYFRHPGVTVFTLIAGALLFLWAEKRFIHEALMHSLSLERALIIGCAQTFALIPGVSRSGITIVVGMMCGLRRDEAARFSFLLATPITFGACLLKGLELSESNLPIPHDEKVALIVGVLTSAVGGWMVIRFLLGFLRRHGLQVFAWYRIALALAVAAFLLF
ncbi:MAG TPA: undecaprenyl-diphosphate phosphatase [Candidatus Krumholzibacteria bacterium]|nr:undecaprenyl-diphosphate phosphatase [Candidatus Krumholzibacteria bacterium]